MRVEIQKFFLTAAAVFTIASLVMAQAPAPSTPTVAAPAPAEAAPANPVTPPTDPLEAKTPKVKVGDVVKISAESYGVLHESVSNVFNGFVAGDWCNLHKDDTLVVVDVRPPNVIMQRKRHLRLGLDMKTCPTGAKVSWAIEDAAHAIKLDAEKNAK